LSIDHNVEDDKSNEESNFEATDPVFDLSIDSDTEGVDNENAN
jgi:hypothetical protein